MKTIFLLLVLLASGTFAIAQSVPYDKVPAAVTKAFMTKFPGASRPTWELEDGNYEAEFKINNTEKEASFDKDGKWLSSEVDIKISELPKAVSETLAKQFAAYKVTSAEKVEGNDGKTYYDADLAKGSEKLEARFSADGKLVRQWEEK